MTLRLCCWRSIISFAQDFHDPKFLQRSSHAPLSQKYFKISRVSTRSISNFRPNFIVIPKSNFSTDTLSRKQDEEMYGQLPRCWSCSKMIEGTQELFCKGCNVLQPLPPGTNFFEMFGIDEKFDIDTNNLSNTYKNLQRKLHPDVFQSKSQKEKELSSSQSSAVNHAYKVLKEPHIRAQYLLKLRGIEFGEVTVTDPELLMEIMEKRETVENGSLEEVKSIGHEIKKEYGECVTELSKAFDDNNLDKASELTGKLQYLHTIKHAVEDRLGGVIS